MIALSASGFAAEVPVHLANPVTPWAPVTGYAWGGTDLQAWWPVAGSFADAPTGDIVEKGFGDYALQGTSTNTAVAGCVYVYSNLYPTTSQPWRSYDFVVDPSDPVLTEVPFVLLLESDPLGFSGGVTGHGFSLGEVQIRFAGGGYADVALDQIEERGFGMYAVVLTSGQRTNADKVYVSAQVSNVVPFTAYYDMVLSGAPVSTNPPTVTVVSPTPGAAPGTPGGFPQDFAAAAATPIVLQVTDVPPGVQYVCVTAVFTGAGYVVEEVVFRRGLFRGPYVAGSTQRPLDIYGGLQLSCVRAGGWLGNVTFSVDALSTTGYEDS